MSRTKNMFNDYQRPVKPVAIPAQQLTDTRPRSAELKKDLLASVNKTVIVGELKVNPENLIGVTDSVRMWGRT